MPENLKVWARLQLPQPPNKEQGILPRFLPFPFCCVCLDFSSPAPMRGNPDKEGSAQNRDCLLIEQAHNNNTRTIS